MTEHNPNPPPSGEIDAATAAAIQQALGEDGVSQHELFQSFERTNNDGTSSSDALQFGSPEYEVECDRINGRVPVLSNEPALASSSGTRQTLEKAAKYESWD
ncbi:hypothetical protein LTR10_008620 [Elasticomyces elasticus]|nr:hypothetical protein LTR10_008620 [Elasticomyces elasticus]